MQAPVRLDPDEPDAAAARLIRNPILWALKRPVVLFVHPWEFIDLTRSQIPFDCRYRTGAPGARSTCAPSSGACATAAHDFAGSRSFAG